MAGMNNGNSLHKPGDYRLQKFTLTSLVNGTQIDLSNLFNRIEIYEDLFSPYLTAKVYIEDAYNFPERIPLLGQEKIEISFKTDLEALPVVDLVLRLYKFDSHKISETGKTQQYVLHLMSEGGYFNDSQYCGYAVSGSVAEMVYTVFKKHFPETLWDGRLQIEPTNDNYSFVLPGAYTPFKAITWLTSKAYASTGKQYSPFVFYETLDGHRFKSLSKIIEEGSADTVSYLYTLGNMRALPGEREMTNIPALVNSPLPTRYHKVQELEELGRFDAASNIMNGVVSSRMVVHDLLRKEHRDVQFFETEVFDDMRKLGTENHFRAEDTEAVNFLKNGAAYFYMPTTPYTIHNQSNQVVDNFNTESLFLARKYHMNTFLTQKIAMTIFGDSRKRVGDIINLSVPKIQSDSGFQTENDKCFSGDYMVTGIRHTLTDTYQCKVELSRNGMGV